MAPNMFDGMFDNIIAFLEVAACLVAAMAFAAGWAARWYFFS